MKVEVFSLVDGVFPACAGMIRLDLLGTGAGLGVPRVRGDDPAVSVLADGFVVCSPRARG